MASSFIYNLHNYQTFFPHPSKRSHFGIKICSYQPQMAAFLLSKTCSNVELFSIFLQIFFLELIFATIKIKTISYFVDQLSEKYCIYYVSEHLKYSTQINEYGLNKNICLNIVLYCLTLLTYIHNWPLQPFSQYYDLASYASYIVCVNFVPEWRDLQF